MVIMQGDSYKIPIAINIDGVLAEPSAFSDVEIYIGGILKTVSNGDLQYSAEENAFLFPITQEEAFKLSIMPQRAQVRCKFKNGDVIGTKLDNVNVALSMSKAVL